MYIFPNRDDCNSDFFEKRYDNGEYLSLSEIALIRAHHDTVIDLLQSIDIKDGIILDIGCACGDFTKRLVEFFPEAKVFGIDFFWRGLSIGAERHSDLNLVQAMLPHLPFTTGSVTLAVCMEILYYLDDISRENAIQELYRVLNPEGYLVVSTTLGDSNNYFTEESLKGLIASNFDLADKKLEHLKFYTKLMTYLRRSSQKMQRINVIPKILMSLRRNIWLANAGKSIGQSIGSSSVSNGVFLFKRKSNCPAKYYEF